MLINSFFINSNCCLKGRALATAFIVFYMDFGLQVVIARIFAFPIDSMLTYSTKQLITRVIEVFWILFGSEFGVRTELRALQLLLRLLVRSGTYCLRGGPGIFF